MNIPAKVRGEAALDRERHGLSKGNTVVIPAGTEHNAVNTSITERLRLYIFYSPPYSASSPVTVPSTDLAHRRRAAGVGFDLYPHG
jgi:mannose-6-phosphate isomerase-like protein (cupin superfamily)